jgi:hypothetical protein
MIELMFLGSAAFAGGAHAVRQSRGRNQPRQRARRDSLLVKAWNSAGAPRTEESMLGDALADLGGRAIGSTVRRTAPRVRRRARSAHARAASRWQRRTEQDRTVTFFRRRNRSANTTPTGTDGPGGTPHGGARAADEPVLPRGAAPRPLPHPAAPRSPIPMPPGHPTTATMRGRATGGAPRGQSSGRGPARGRGRARAQSRMRIAVPLDLDAPDTDEEFLSACADLQQMLRGIGVAVEDWNDELMIRRLPPIVTGPLERVHEGLVDGAARTALATVLFENWFAEAREIAAAGIEFTGEDPE